MMRVATAAKVQISKGLGSERQTLRAVGHLVPLPTRTGDATSEATRHQQRLDA